MDGLKWSYDKPRTGGAWFYRNAKWAIREMVDLYLMGDDWLVLGQYGGKAHVSNMHGEWSGPIPEPTEDTQPHYIDPAVKTDLNQKLFGKE